MEALNNRSKPVQDTNNGDIKLEKFQMNAYIKSIKEN